MTQNCLVLSTVTMTVKYFNTIYASLWIGPVIWQMTFVAGVAGPIHYVYLSPFICPFIHNSFTYLNPARGLGSAVSSPAGSGAEPQPKSNLVRFSHKI